MYCRKARQRSAEPNRLQVRGYISRMRKKGFPEPVSI
jgi:hypothetical protein